MDGRERMSLYPRGRGYVSTLKRTRFIYALGLSNGRTKIGVCGGPRSRFMQHWYANDGNVTWTHLFAPIEYADADRIERRALILAAEVSQRIRRTETFWNLDREQAIRCVRSAIAECDRYRVESRAA